MKALDIGLPLYSTYTRKVSTSDLLYYLTYRLTKEALLIVTHPATQVAQFDTQNPICAENINTVRLMKCISVFCVQLASTAADQVYILDWIRDVILQCS